MLNISLKNDYFPCFMIKTNLFSVYWKTTYFCKILMMNFHFSINNHVPILRSIKNKTFVLGWILFYFINIFFLDTDTDPDPGKWGNDTGRDPQHLRQLYLVRVPYTVPGPVMSLKIDLNVFPVCLENERKKNVVCENSEKLVSDTDICNKYLDPDLPT